MRMQVPAVPPRGIARSAGNEVAPPQNALGEFLRLRRAQLNPADVGLSPDSRRSRRVEGLRREEVSVLTGVSVDYYSRLEQGRVRTPSARILEALVRAFQLEATARGHLFRLAGLNPRLHPDSVRAQIHPDLLELMEQSHRAAAWALSPCLDMLAANAPARAVLSPFGSETNAIRLAFAHPEAQEFFADWPAAAMAAVSVLRHNVVRLPQNTDILDLVAEMSSASADFTRMWQNTTTADVGYAQGTVVHPAAGRITLTCRVIGAPTAPGQHLLIAAPPPEGRSAEAFTYLAAMGSSAPAGHRHPPDAGRAERKRSS
ncbi:helix-turn-helix transcriptional regulator [Streptomyces olivaceus]|uniref:helix-turn-helix transcriptional regulator n=1 Tax=Streptomyces olivaceus TaxID=47716 RepID=UPI0022EE0943|nr:helix-turn-helix transcriptional regulator [Streptomyces olivaceus]GHI99343.1 transcriptional regulator [Streptomyces olivaceus]